MKDIELFGWMNLFHRTFQGEPVKKLNDFMRMWIERGVKNWTIYSDYCIGDRTKQYNAIVFTIIPYADDLNDLRRFMGNIATSDLKKMRRIDERFCGVVKSGYVYNVAIVYERGICQFCRGRESGST